MLANLQAVKGGCLAAGLKWRPTADGGRQRALVEIIEFAAHRDAVRQSRNFDLGVVEEVGDVVRRALPVDGGIERQDDLLHCGIVCTPGSGRRW